MALVVKNLPANARDIDAGSIPGSGRSPGEGHGNPLQYSCLENSTDRGAWQATVHRVAKNRARLQRLSKHVQNKYIIAKLFLGVKPVALKQEHFCPPEDKWQCPETWVVTTLWVLPACSGWRPEELLMFYSKLNNPHNKGSSSYTYQFCQGWETLG